MRGLIPLVAFACGVGVGALATPSGAEATDGTPPIEGPSATAPAVWNPSSRAERPHDELVAELRATRTELADQRAANSLLERRLGAGRLRELELAVPRDRLVALDPERFTGLSIDEVAHLRDLDLQATAVTDDDLSWIAELPALRSLSLRATVIGDAGIEQLRGHERLSRLDLRGTCITDDGLAALAGLASLRRLDVRATAVSGSGVARFAECRPHCALLAH